MPIYFDCGKNGYNYIFKQDSQFMVDPCIGTYYETMVWSMALVQRNHSTRC